MSSLDGTFANQQQQRLPQSPAVIVMTLQSREIGSAGTTGASELQVAISHDKTRPKGCRVEVGGTLPYTTQRVGELEEFARRGAVFGVAGKVWKWASG